MPVTARLSRRFYERLGDEITNELVDWFNSVDATYRSDLREMNELNFARFEESVDRRFAEFETRLEKRFAAVETLIVAVRAESNQRFAEQETRLAKEIGSLRGGLLKWMFVYWTGSVIAVSGVLFALLKR